MRILYSLLLAIIAFGCSQLDLKPTNFAWPIETVLNVDEDGMISESRYSISTNVKMLFFAETNDSLSFKNASVRMIRDKDGFYFMVAPGFKNVYIFNANNGALSLENKIQVSEFALDLPAFNQRIPYVELLEGEEHLHFLNSDGIKEK